MANEEHLAILRQGSEAWNKWREPEIPVLPDLSDGDLSDVDLSGVFLLGANLSGANLSRVDFSMANLNRVNLTRAKLNGTNFSMARVNRANLREVDFSRTILGGVDFVESNLSGAYLRAVDLGGADLRRADFSGADLTDVNLSGVDLTGARLGGARLNQAIISATIFGDNDLSNVSGLDTVLHNGPSVIGTNTLYRSGGRIPKVFLQGCGVQDSLIEYLTALVGAVEPILYYSCFICYSTKNEEFATRLYSRMRDYSPRIWIANEDLKAGHKLNEQIDRAIHVYDKFVLVLSPDSMRSKWVMDEVRRTRRAELANNQREFFPISLTDYRKIEAWECIDPETGADLAAEIREYFIPDFRGWKNHDKFERAFAQLLEGLKAVDARPAPRVESKSSAVPDRNVSKRRKLRILEDQQARMGIQTPPHVIMEIEDLREELGDG
jgi:hypothetical protein